MEAVRVETTEARPSEFIGYRIPQHEQNDCTQPFHKVSINKSVSGFLDILIGCPDIRI